MKLRITLGLALAWTAAAAASAQVPFGLEFVANAYTTGDQFRASVAFTAQGYVVVWSSRHDAGTLGVFGQRFDTAGVPAGAEFQVNTYTPGRQSDPSVAADGSGRFVVAWGSEQDGGGYGIFAQRYDASGAPKRSRVHRSTAIPPSASGSRPWPPAQWPVRLRAPGGGALTTRTEAPAAPSASATTLPARAPASEFRVNSYTTGCQVVPEVAADAAGTSLPSGEATARTAAVWGSSPSATTPPGSPRGGEFLGRRPRS